MEEGKMQTIIVQAIIVFVTLAFETIATIVVLSWYKNIKKQQAEAKKRSEEEAERLRIEEAKRKIKNLTTAQIQAIELNGE